MTLKETHDTYVKELKDLLEMENTIWGMDIHDRNRYEKLKKKFNKFLEKNPQFSI